MNVFSVTFLFLFLCCSSSALALEGCGLPLPAGLTPGGPSQFQYLTSGGYNRSYLVHVPQTYHPLIPTSLILNYHGNGRNSTYQQNISEMSEGKWDHNYIVVYPQGVNNSWQGPDYAVQNVSDTTFTSELLTKLESQFCIDSTKIFATGKSNGGGFVGLMTCDHELTSRIRAFAPVAGAYYWQFGGAKNCTPSRQIPIMEFHGDLDTTISPLGGEGLGGLLPSVSSWFANKAALNGCHNSSTPQERQYLKDGKVVKDTWFCGQARPLLVRFNETEMIHAWPGGPEQMGDDLVAATPNILQFFAEWSF